MANGTLTARGQRRITVDFDPSMARLINEAAESRSTIYRRTTVSDIVREAVARFLLPVDGPGQVARVANSPKRPPDG